MLKNVSLSKNRLKSARLTANFLEKYFTFSEIIEITKKTREQVISLTVFIKQKRVKFYSLIG